MEKLPWEALQARLPRETDWTDADLCLQDRGNVETAATFYVK